MCPVSLAFTHHFQCNGFFTVSVSLALFPYEHFFFSLHTINAKSCTFSAAFAKCRTDIVVVGFLTIVFLLCIFCLPLLLCCSSFNFTFRTSHAHQYQCNWKILHRTNRVGRFGFYKIEKKKCEREPYASHLKWSNKHYSLAFHVIAPLMIALPRQRNKDIIEINKRQSYFIRSYSFRLQNSMKFIAFRLVYAMCFCCGSHNSDRIQCATNKCIYRIIANEMYLSYNNHIYLLRMILELFFSFSRCIDALLI